MLFPKFLKVGVLEDFRESSNKEENKVKKFNAECVDFVRLLSETLGFRYDLRAPSDGEYGKRLPDGNWTGMVGMIQRGEADIIVAKLSITEGRNEVISFSYPYTSGDVTFAVQSPTYLQDTTAFLKPFSVYVWFAVLTYLIIIPCLFYVITNRKYSITKIFLLFYCAFFGKTLVIRCDRLGERILLTIWKIGTMFLSYSYSAVLFSFLTIPTLVGVRNIHELSSEIINGKYKCISYPGSFYSYALLSSKEPHLQIIGASILENKGTDDINSALENTTESYRAFVGTRRDFLPLRGRYFISDDVFFPYFDAIAMQKSFCCKAQLDKVVSYIWAGGLFQKIEADRAYKEYLTKHSYLSADYIERKSTKKLALEDLKGPFILLVSLYALAAILLLCEIVLHKLSI